MESIWKILFNNGERKYKCSFEWIPNNVVYVRLCFITLNGWNAKWSRVKPCAQCIVRPTINLVGDYIFVMVWIGLLSICISTFFLSIDVQFLSSVQNYLYICEFSNLVLIPNWGLWKCIHITDFEKGYVYFL